MYLYKKMIAFFNIALATIVLVAGLLLILSPHFNILQSFLIQQLVGNFVVVNALGAIMLLAATFILWHIFKNSSKRWLQFDTALGNVKIDPQVIENTLDRYWKQLFPEDKIQHEIFVKRKAIKLHVNLPFVPHDQETALLSRVHKDIEELIHLLAGKNYSLKLRATFAPTPD